MDLLAGFPFGPRIMHVVVVYALSWVCATVKWVIRVCLRGIKKSGLLTLVSEFFWSRRSRGSGWTGLGDFDMCSV
jgi:hypothetical protein